MRWIKVKTLEKYPEWFFRDFWAVQPALYIVFLRPHQILNPSLFMRVSWVKFRISRDYPPESKEVVSHMVVK